MPLRTTRLSVAVALCCGVATGCASRGGYVRNEDAREMEHDVRVLEDVELPRSFARAIERPSAADIDAARFESDPTESIAEVHAAPIETDVTETFAEIQLVSQPTPAAEDSATVNDDGSQFAPLPAVAGISIEELEQAALENNPTIRQLMAMAYQTAGYRDQVGRYPNPTVGYSGQQIADAGTEQHSVFVEQEIVRGDKLWLNERVLNAATSAQMREIQVQQYRVLTDIRVRFYEALGAQRRVAVAREYETIAARAVEVARQRNAIQEGTQAEILQAEVLLRQIELIRQQAEYALAGAWGDLVAVAGVPYMSNPGLIGDLDVDAQEQDWESRYAMLTSVSPELSAARARVTAARANMERQEAQPTPNLAFNVGTGYDNGTNSGMLNLQVGAPIPVFNRNDGNVRAAYGEYCSATHDVRRIEMSLRSRLARAAQEYDSALVAVNKYRDDILPNAQQSLALAEQAYSLVEGEFLQLLVFQRTALDANVEYINALTQLAQANSELEGLLLTGGLDQPADVNWSDELRGQTLSGQ